MSENTPPVAHTPLPYLREGTLIYALDESGSVNRISMRLEGGYTGRNRERTTDEELEATAAFIAHAVNSHSDLVQALRHLITCFVDELGSLADENEIEDQDLAAVLGADYARKVIAARLRIRQARAILAKVEPPHG